MTGDTNTSYVEVDDIDVEIAIAEAIAVMNPRMVYHDKGEPALAYLKGMGWKIMEKKSATSDKSLEEINYKQKYEALKEFVRGKWKGDCSECAALANTILNQESEGESK